MSNKQLVAASLAMAVASSGVLARALVEIEHDREKHIPGVKSGPNAETFVLPQAAFEALERAGCVERVGVVDTAELLDEHSTGPVVTFADVADTAQIDDLKAQLQQARNQVADLSTELQTVIEQRDELQQLVEAPRNPEAGGDTGTDAGDVVGDGAQADSAAQPAEAAEQPADAPAATARSKPAAKTARARS